MARIRPLHAAILVQMLRPLARAGMQGAEIGVLKGVTSKALLEHLPDLFLWMVDSWSACSPDSAYFASQDGVARFSQADHLANLEEAFNRTAFAASRRACVRADSVAAAKGIPAGSLDFVFIDADHTYDAVQRDIETWWPKIRLEGILCGHDYGGRRNRHGLWGVNRAVDEFVARHDLALHVEPGRVWWVSRADIKKTLPTLDKPVQPVRVVFGDLPNNLALQREIELAFRHPWAKEHVVHLVAGRANAQWLIDRGAKRVDLLLEEPVLPNTDRFGIWYMKTFLVAKGMESYPEILYSDFDCRLLRTPDELMTQKLRARNAGRFGGTLLAPNVGYRNPICLTVHRDPRCHTVRRCLSGSIFYCRDRQWLLDWLAAYEDIAGRGIGFSRINDESVLIHALDRRYGAMDAAQMTQEFEIPIAWLRRNTQEAKAQKVESEAYFFHR